jgi:poly-gamma-glutamate capsule biosynthesis protein CapA/YwtB (metallophosphatase superfamily)
VSRVLGGNAASGSTPASTGRPTSPASPGSTASTPPGASPSASSTQTHRGALLIHGAGDTNVDPSYIGVSPSNYSFMLSGLNGLFTRDDLTVVNLECAVSNVGNAVHKEFNFRGDPRALPYLKSGGVDVANMANNHSYDFGPDALVDTRKNIERAGLAAMGAGASSSQATKAAIFHVKGWTIAVVGIDKVVDPYPEAVAGPDHPGTACGHDTNCMVDEVKRAATISDLTIVDIHWGVELDTQPRAEDVDLAKRLIDAGADIIFGGHSHRLQPMATYRGKPIFYSLGNFVWPHLSQDSATTAIAEVRVSPSGKLTGRMIPASIEANGHPVVRG